jgi:hypothetical protein
MNCAAYPQFIQRVPEPMSNDAAREGTCAAWVAEMVINGDASCGEDMIGKVHANGWEVDEVMAGHIDNYVSRLPVGHPTFDGPPVGKAEVHSVMIEGMLEGTADYATYDLPTRTLDIVDLKYGFNIVDPFHNSQLGCYGSGIIGWAAGIVTGALDFVNLHIFQPRAPHREGPWRTWRLSYAEFLEWREVVMEAALATLAPDPTATAGEWCKHCPAAHSCESLRLSAYSMWDTVESCEMFDLNPRQIADELDMLERMESVLKARKTAALANAESLSMTGTVIPGWAIIRGSGRARLSGDMDVLKMLTGVDPYEQKLKTPAHMKRDGVPEAVIETFTDKPETSGSIQRLSDDFFVKQFGRGVPKL